MCILVVDINLKHCQPGLRQHPTVKTPPPILERTFSLVWNGEKQEGLPSTLNHAPEHRDDVLNTSTQLFPIWHIKHISGLKFISGSVRIRQAEESDWTKESLVWSTKNKVCHSVQLGFRSLQILGYMNKNDWTHYLSPRFICMALLAQRCNKIC